MFFDYFFQLIFYKIETCKTIVRDFELIRLCIVLDIDFEKLKILVTD